MTYMLFAGWEVRLVKNCDRSLENAAFSSPRSQFFTIRTVPKPVNNLFIFFLSPKRREKTHANVTVTVVRDRKIRTALRTNQIAEFFTVTAWKKIMCISIITQVIIEIRALPLAENGVIFRYNHLRGGEYNGCLAFCGCA